MSKNIRKKIIVDKSFQLRFFFETLVLVLFVAVIVGWTVYLAIFRTFLFDLGGEKLTLINHAITLRLLLWFLPSLGAILIISVFLSHKIAGPVFVFKRTVRELVDGKCPGKIRLRKNDEFHDFAEDMNILIDYLDKKYACKSSQTMQAKR